MIIYLSAKFNINNYRGLGAGIFVILVILIVIVLIYNSKTKNLMEQVNKISFVQQDKKGNDENLLLDDDNELK